MSVRHRFPEASIFAYYYVLDDPYASDGVPAAIQILGRGLEEEKILSIAQIVADALLDYKSDEV